MQQVREPGTEMYREQSVPDYGEEVRWGERQEETSINDVSTIGECILEKNIPTSYSHRINFRWIKKLSVENETQIFMNKTIK